MFLSLAHRVLGYDPAEDKQLREWMDRWINGCYNDHPHVEWNKWHNENEKWWRRWQSHLVLSSTNDDKTEKTPVESDLQPFGVILFFSSNTKHVWCCSHWQVKAFLTGMTFPKDNTTPGYLHMTQPFSAASFDLGHNSSRLKSRLPSPYLRHPDFRGGLRRTQLRGHKIPTVLLGYLPLSRRVGHVYKRRSPQSFFWVKAVLTATVAIWSPTRC